MKIGIDVSQIAYPATGVGNYVKQLITNLVVTDRENEYIFFASSLRQKQEFICFQKALGNYSHVTWKIFSFPPTFLDMLWNTLHIVPIEFFIGNVDVFISSDWTQPPTIRAKKVTILYDLIIYKYPQESHNQVRFSLKNLLIKPNIVSAQKRKLHWVKKEADAVICISEATKKDAVKLLHIPEEKLFVTYPGV